MGELSSLVKGTSVYEEKNTNYKVEESRILKEDKELAALFKSLKAKEQKNETET